MNFPQSEPRLKEIPKVPKEFGEDGGNFYRYYDALADELDEDMVKSLKSQLDGILIFGGLFAGVNSAFLALTLPEMSADPADDTNALLLQLVTGGNSTLRSADDLPSATFAPAPGIFPVNVLFSLSLTLAIIASFLAILGQQWLVYYRKRSGGGAEFQRWEQLRRYLGARRWRLELLLDDILPGSLQLALAVFCVAFALYLRTLSKTIYYVITTPLATAMALLFFMAIAALFDQWCPFKSPWSRLFESLVKPLPRVFRSLTYQRQIVTKPVIAILRYVILLPPIVATFMIILAIRLILNAKTFLVHKLWNRHQSSPGFLSLRTAFMTADNRVADLILGYSTLRRPGEGIALLQAEAVKRVLCASEDFNALIYTGINLLAITEKGAALCLLEDDAAHGRLEELIINPEDKLASVFACAFTHLLMGGQSAELFIKSYGNSGHFLTSTERWGKGAYRAHPLGHRISTLIQGVRKLPELNQGREHEGGLFLYLYLLRMTFNEWDRSSDFTYRSMLNNNFLLGQQTFWGPLRIWVVANSVCLKNQRVAAAHGRSSMWLPRQGKVHFLKGGGPPQMEVVKALIRTAGWEMQYFPPSDSQG
ncbi:hypothetical protein FRC01_014460, partial [Tulasnella sp. 417]